MRSGCFISRHRNAEGPVLALPEIFPVHVYSNANRGDDLPELRDDVRRFLADELAAGTIRPGVQTWTTCDRGFSQRAAERGFVAMTWPAEYGGGEKSQYERYVVCEEMLAAGAPVGGHWCADRQSGPQIMRNGTDSLKKAILPRIAAGNCIFGIGMSEPGSGSDLSSITTRADKVDGGWRLHGRKIWTTNAHEADYIIALVRTAPKGDDRYVGISQLVVPMRGEGIDVRPLVGMNEEHEFNEILFDGNFVPEDHLLGQEGDGWKLVTEELDWERSGPDRFLSTFGVLRILAQATSPDSPAAAELGQLTARLIAIRDLSLVVNEKLGGSQSVGGLATITKELGTSLEQEIPDIARRLIDVPLWTGAGPWAEAMRFALLSSPSFSLRGGTREILKGIIARELGLR